MRGQHHADPGLFGRIVAYVIVATVGMLVMGVAVALTVWLVAAATKTGACG